MSVAKKIFTGFVSTLGATALVAIAVAPANGAELTQTNFGDEVSAAEIRTALQIAENSTEAKIVDPIRSSLDADGFYQSTTNTDVSVQVPVDSGAAIELSSPGGTSISIGLPSGEVFENGQLSPDGRITFAGSSAVGAAVIPSEQGVQVVTTYANASASRTASYKLNVPLESRLEILDGVYYVLDDSHTYIALEAPWAIDARGDSVPTRYSLSNGILTQFVAFDETTQFPVVADPTWSYLWEYDTAKSPATVYAMLHRCFNCYFPVAGAPAAYPAVGDVLDLWVPVLGAAPVTVVSSAYRNLGNEYYSFAFRANAGHFDGEGSSISFAFTANQKMTVRAWVENIWTSSPAFQTATWTNWFIFSQNLMNGSL